jgi:pimeloyl-ACP methyl ester carboxylesterase
MYLQGGDSPEPFRLAGEALAAALPDCRVVVMPGQRHAAMDTGTELFLAEVLSFLGDD